MADDLNSATLDDMRAMLAAEIPHHASFDGWNTLALNAAADALSIERSVAGLAFPGGAVQMIDAWFAHIDRVMTATCPPDVLAAMKVRAKIAALVEARIDALVPDIEALRRALAILALPQNVLRAARLGWRAADAVWHVAGDTATDLNHYSKRTLLTGIYAATLMALLDDDSEGQADTRAFLGRRIDGVMRFEKAKARFMKPPTERPSLARFFGRLRYPAV